MGWNYYRRRLHVRLVLSRIGTLLKDDSGARYIANKTPNLDWTCALTVKSRETWKEWRMRVLGPYFSLSVTPPPFLIWLRARTGTIVAVFGMYILRRRRVYARSEDKRVAELVQLALATLR